MVDEVPPGAVVITPAQMYAEMREVRSKVEDLTKLVDPALTVIRDTQTDHESRIRLLEKKLWLAAGIAATSGAGLAELFAILQK